MVIGPALTDTTHRPLSAVSLAADDRRVQLTANPHRLYVSLRVGTPDRYNDRHFNELDH